MGQLPVLVGIFAIDGLSVLVVYLDQRAGQRLSAGNVLFRDGDRGVNQSIQNWLIQGNSNDIFVCHLVFGRQLHRVLRTQVPASRNRKFLDVVVPMWIQAGECQAARGIGNAGRYQRIGRELLIVAVGHYAAGEQTKHKPFAGNDLHGLVDHPFRGFIHANGFLPLTQRYPNRQISVGGGHAHLDNSGFLVCRGQRKGVRCCIKNIAVWRGDFPQFILPQGQNLRLNRARRAGRQGFHQIPLMIENRAFLADNIFRGAELKYSVGQITILVHWLHDGITELILFIRETHQL